MKYFHKEDNTSVPDLDLSKYAEEPPTDVSLDTNVERTSVPTASNAITIESYHNRAHRNLFIILVSLGYFLAVVSLSCGIPAWIITANYPRIAIGADGQMMDSQRFLPLYATGVVVVAVEIAMVTLVTAFSLYAMQHERNENAGVRIKLHMLTSERMALAFMATIMLLLVMFFGFYVAFVVEVTNKREKWNSLTYLFCPIDQLGCDRVAAGLKLFQVSSIVAMLSIVPLMMITTASMSHAGSHKTKVIPTNAQSAP